MHIAEIGHENFLLQDSQYRSLGKIDGMESRMALGVLSNDDEIGLSTAGGSFRETPPSHASVAHAAWVFERSGRFQADI